MSRSPAGEILPVILIVVVFPLASMWWSRDAIRRRHVTILLGVALTSAIVAVVMLKALPGFSGTLAAIVPATILLGAGMLGIGTLVAALAGAFILATRDEAAHRSREAAFAASGEPRRPSLQPLSRRETEGRLIASLASLSGVFAYAFVRGVMATEVQNYLRMLGLFSGPNGPYRLSYDATPVPYVLQLAVAVLLSIGFGTLALSRYRRHRLGRTAYR
ncbi:MAG: hypothetical protein IPN16_20695 [Gemmatimonadetes bacterium]|nr:hypothetical protein [Gemmatimonadota bacterium]